MNTEDRNRIKRYIDAARRTIIDLDCDEAQLCRECMEPIPLNRRVNAKFCSRLCAKRAADFRRWQYGSLS